METGHNFISSFAVHGFRSSYEGWKQVASQKNKGGTNVSDLPMRDGNGFAIFSLVGMCSVSDLPMRDGNAYQRASG